MTHGKPEHPHNSDEFFAHTGLQEYPKYMVGGGYVISDDVARWVSQWPSLLAALCPALAALGVHLLCRTSAVILLLMQWPAIALGTLTIATRACALNLEAGLCTCSALTDRCCLRAGC